jgi:hypothetical protein
LVHVVTALAFTVPGKTRRGGQSTCPGCEGRQQIGHDGACTPLQPTRGESTVAAEWAEAQARRAASPRAAATSKAMPAEMATSRRPKAPTPSRAIAGPAIGNVVAGGPVTVMTYTVPGRPFTWKRADGRGKRRFNTREHEAAKVVHHLAFAAARGRRHWPIDGAYELGVRGVYPDARCGDLDKLIAIVMDGLEGIAWTKDRKVRRYIEPTEIVCDGTAPRVEVTIRRLDVDPVQPKPRARHGRDDSTLAQVAQKRGGK